MTEDRIARLEAIGFEWSVKKPYREKVPWESRFKELKQYKKKHGTCHVPHVKSGAHKQLADWVTYQRSGYSEFIKARQAGKPTVNCRGMTEDRIARLEKIGFEWSFYR